VCAASSSRAESPHDDSLLQVQGLRPDVVAVTAARGSAAFFKGGITYVTVPVVVIDASGQAVAGLSAGDFSIYENDAKQTLERLAERPAPVSLALVVDTSESMRSEVSQLRNALLRFLATLPPEHHIMLASFDERVQVHAEADAGRERIRLALWRMDRRAGTRLYDAVALVGRRAQTLGDRKGIVLLTDGVDTRSRLADAESTLQAAGQSHVPVYVIQYDTTRNDYALPSGVRSGGMDIRDMSPVVLPEDALDNRALFARAADYLAALSDTSGGRLYRADSLPNLNQAFAQVVRDLGDQYTLGYYPTNQAHDGTYRKLRVEVDRPGVAVRARAGYRAASR
jgi:VWFA-related protein